MTAGREHEEQGELRARGDLSAELRGHAAAGRAVLLHGPAGIGKTALLLELAAWARATGRRCGFAPRTGGLADATRALADAYPEVVAGAARQRAVRSGLRRAVESSPCVLLLDDLADASSPLKGFLRSLRGTGVGVVLAVDVDHPRDHTRARSLGLTHREIAVPRLHGAALRRILADRTAGAALPHPLAEADRAAMLHTSEGRPGKLIAMIELLAGAAYWHDGRARIELLRMDAGIALARARLPAIGGRPPRLPA